MISVRRAGIDDLEALVTLRLALLEEAGIGHGGDSRDQTLAEATRRYLQESLQEGSFLSWIAESEGEIIACSGLVRYRRPPTGGNLSGWDAYVMNMYTKPAWRGRGLATRLLETMLAYLSDEGVQTVWLKTTEMGRPIYEKAGFVPLSQAMQLKDR